MNEYEYQNEDLQKMYAHLGPPLENPVAFLREYQNGTVFILIHNGWGHLCKLDGNLPGDERWKFVRLSDCKRSSLQKLKDFECIFLYGTKWTRKQVTTWTRQEVATELALLNKPSHHLGEKYAKFGRLLWEMINRGPANTGSGEGIVELLPIAERAGLCRKVFYDPAKHGDISEAEPGSKIWYWGDEKTGPAAFPNQITNSEP